MHKSWYNARNKEIGQDNTDSYQWRETAVIKTKRGRRTFRPTCVRPVVNSILKEETNETSTGNEGESVECVSHEDDEHIKMPSGMETDGDGDEVDKNKTGRKKNLAGAYTQSRKEELLGLLNEGKLVIVEIMDVPEDERIFGSRFVGYIKKAGEEFRKKFRLVTQNYSDQDPS